MNLMFTRKAWADYRHWQDQDRQVLKKLNILLEDCCRSPFAGLGKPEPLRNEFSGQWSRRITGEHRLVYRVERSDEAQVLVILQCRYHY